MSPAHGFTQSVTNAVNTIVVNPGPDKRIVIIGLSVYVFILVVITRRLLKLMLGLLIIRLVFLLDVLLPVLEHVHKIDAKTGSVIMFVETSFFSFVTFSFMTTLLYTCFCSVFEVYHELVHDRAPFPDGRLPRL